MKMRKNYKSMNKMLGSKYIANFSMILAEQFFFSLLVETCVINKKFEITQVINKKIIK